MAALGRIISQYDRILDKEVKFSYDAAGNRTEILNTEDSEERIISYTYDIKNRISSMINLQGNITCFKYDELDREIERILPNGNRILREYIGDGELKKSST